MGTDAFATIFKEQTAIVFQTMQIFVTVSVGLYTLTAIELYLTILESGYEQERPQSHTADKLTAT